VDWNKWTKEIDKNETTVSSVKSGECEEERESKNR